MAVGGIAAQALTLRTPAPQRRHVGLDPPRNGVRGRGFVDEDQPLGIEPACTAVQRRRRRTTSARACSSANRVFLKLSFSRRRNRQTVSRDTNTPRAANSACSCASVRCGVRRTCSTTKSRCGSSRRGRRPPIFAGATLPVSRYSLLHFTTDDTATSKRCATTRQLSPDKWADTTRSRRSIEQGFTMHEHCPQ